MECRAALAKRQGQLRDFDKPQGIVIVGGEIEIAFELLPGGFGLTEVAMGLGQQKGELQLLFVVRWLGILEDCQGVVGAAGMQRQAGFEQACVDVLAIGIGAGCEQAAELGDTPLLLVHGTHDELLPPETSGVVQMLAGHGEVMLCAGAGHLLTEAAADIRARLRAWIPARFGRTAA
ncbi:MAG: hypothetical protein K6T86_02935 [Pirellulales bacterium]|nr:hypothetical protein [Pirellulales bacterium]